jgi:hypothetical protein
MEPTLNKSTEISKISIGVAVAVLAVVALAFWKTNLGHHIVSAGSRINSVMPLLSTLFLVLLSLFVAIPGIFPSFETTIKKFRWFLAFLCIVIGLWGFLIDVHQHGAADELNKTLLKDAEETLRKTNDIASGINEALETLHTLPTIAQIDGEIDAKLKQLNDPTNAHNVALVNSLKQEIAELRKKRNDADYQSNIARLPIVIEQLKYWREPFIEAKTDVDARRNDAPFSYQGQALTDYDATLVKRLENAKEASLENLRKIVMSADPLRQLMLARIPTSAPNDEDKRWAQEFTETMKAPYERFDGEAAAKYLEDLKKRADASTRP